MTTQQLTLENIASNQYLPKRVEDVNPMRDGESYTQLSQNRIIRHSFKTGKKLEVIFDLKEANNTYSIKNIDGYTMSPNETQILLQTKTVQIYRRSYKAFYYLYDIQTKSIKPLSDEGPQQMPRFSPDGNLIAFVRKNNIFIVNTSQHMEIQVTKDGKVNEIINGLPDWVYEEEFATNCSFDFSSDSRVLAWLRYDESKVPMYIIEKFKGMSPEISSCDEYPGRYTYKYPVAGARNSDVGLMIFDIKSGATDKINIPLDSDGYIPRIQFTSDPDKLAVVTLNRHQDRMEIYIADSYSTECKLVVREENPKYIVEDAYSSLKFYDNHFGYISDRSNYKHIYWYDFNGNLEYQVTNGDYDVKSFFGYDNESERFFYSSNKEGPLYTSIYSIDKNGNEVKLSSETGTNDAIFSKSMKYFLNIYSSSIQPPITTSCESTSGKALNTIIDNNELKESLVSLLGKKEFFTFKTNDSIELNGWMIKPRNFNPNKQYPLIMFQYSGPGSQKVLDSWGIGLYAGGVFESYMVNHGFIFACVDGRGTGGRGADFEKCTYMKLGELESHDQVEAAIYMGSLPYIDKNRIGIWGWSYGGFNTLMSMSEGRPVFRAGVAVAAPSNWKYYDTIYTERYMRTPKENPLGYSINPIERACELSGDLLLIHGTADDNVHFRNFTEVSEAYVQAGKLFRQQVYTNRNHNIIGGKTRLHLLKTITNFFIEKLK